LENKEAVLKKILEWQRSNHGKMNAIRARRRASLIDATPEWASAGEIWIDIVAFYDSCPEGFEVDHVVPLKGKTVCGLHVPWNFQYLTKSENSSKGNRLQN
jgi:5-methylcytosine-specific restriction endonuclease McrA